MAYVNQIEDERLDPVVTTGSYLEATEDALHKHGGLWFNDEAFVVTRSGVGSVETVRSADHRPAN